MLESEIAEINEFINSCDKDFYNDIYDKEKINIARKYYQRIKQIIEYDKNAYFVAISEKLWFIIRNISIHYKKNKTSIIKPEEALNLVSRNSVTEYVISLIIEKRLTDPKLIARFAYLELSKFVYYDISYSKISDIRQKSIIVNTPINVYNAKIFSYVVCTQWLQLYTYILSQFGIMVKKNNRPGEDHVWGEIDINDNEIIIVDATDFIDNSIDLGNAKSLSPTKGFLIVPKKYSGIKLFDVYSREENKTILEDVKPYYELNRDLDVSLNIIEKSTYPVEEILESKLVNKNEKGEFIDRFRKRLMFPIQDERGRFIAFGGRILIDPPKADASEEEKLAFKKQAKYINSTENIAYSKGRHLFGLYAAKKAAHTPTLKKVLIVEGYMDTISLHQRGITNVVASLGTALTEAQGRLLRKSSEQVIVGYDADGAGQAATLRGLGI